MNKTFNDFKQMIIQKLPSIPIHITEEWLRFALENDLFYLWGFTFSDLSNHTFGNISEEIRKRISISSITKLPQKHPFNISFSDQIDYDIKELHRTGITGEGINVAVIDSSFAIMHDEVKDCIKEYKNLDNTMMIGFHGLTVTSNLAGKNLGVAPGAKIHFYGCNQLGEIQDKYYLEALKDIYLKNLNGANIRIVNISAGRHMSGPYSNDFKNIISQLKNQGCYVLDSHTYKPDKFHNFPYINQRNINGKPTYFLSLEIQEKVISKPIPSEILENIIAVPFTGLSPLAGTTSDYQLGGECSLSWTLPRLSGIFALCLQVNPDLTYEEFCQLAKETKIKTEEGIPLINPKGLIQKLSFEMKEGKGLN